MAAPLRFLLRTLAFAAFCAGLYPLLVAAIGFMAPDGYAPNLRYPLNGYGHQRTRMEEAARHGPVDIVFLGSSHTYRGFDPRIWARRGYRAFNLGSSAQTPLQTELVVRAHVPRLQPRLAIVEVHPGRFLDPGIESAVDFIANRPIDLHTVRMALHLPDILVWNALAYGLVRQLAGYDARLPEAAVRGHDRYVPGGYVAREGGHFRPSGQVRPAPYRPQRMQEEAMERAIEELRRRGIEVVLVQAPVTQWYYRATHGEQAPFRARVSGMGRYIDMNGKVALDDSLHFFTKGHLNQAGAERFNAALIDTLERRGWLPPRAPR